jgi:hypothetical protein
MNLWIVALIIGLLAVTTVVVIGITTVNAESPEEPSFDCQGTCGPEGNCGLATCGVVSGTGSCGCGG